MKARAWGIVGVVALAVMLPFLVACEPGVQGVRLPDPKLTYSGSPEARFVTISLFWTAPGEMDVWVIAPGGSVQRPVVVGSGGPTLAATILSGAPPGIYTIIAVFKPLRPIFRPAGVPAPALPTSSTSTTFEIVVHRAGQVIARHEGALAVNEMHIHAVNVP